MTNQYTKGVWEKSDPVTFALGGSPAFKLNFLEPFLSTMKAPEIVDMRFEFTGTVDSASSTYDALGIDAHKLCKRLRVADKYGAWIDCSGEGLRINSIIELEARHRDMVTLAAGAADATKTWFVTIPLELIKGQRGEDSTVQVWQLCDGGQVQMSFCGAVPTGWVSFVGTVTLWCKVRDAGTRESKSRLTIRDYQINSQQDNYSIDGSLRSLAVFTELATTSMTSIAAFTAPVSTALGYPPGMTAAILLEDYVRNLDGAAHASDPFIAQLAIPLVTPDRRQSVDKQPILGTIRLDLGAAPPTNGRLLVVAFTERDPRLAAAQLGYPNVATAQAAIASMGESVAANGNHKPAIVTNEKLQRIRPARVRTVRSAG